MRHTGIIKSLVVALAFSSLVPATSMAQELSRGDVARGCAVQQCAALVNRFVAQVQATAQTVDEVDAELAALSQAMASVAETASDEAKARIAAGLQIVAAAINDPAVSQQVAALAGAVAAGGRVGNVPASGA